MNYVTCTSTSQYYIYIVYYGRGSWITISNEIVSQFPWNKRREKKFKINYSSWKTLKYARLD